MNFRRIRIFFLCSLLTTFSLSIFSQTPTLVILNANIRTMDRLKPRAEAVAVTGNKFSAVGSNAQIRRLIGENTKVIDAQGKLVIPGFNDSHVHLFSIGAQFFSLKIQNAKTPAEVLSELKRSAKFLPPGQWIIGNFQKQDNSFTKVLPGLAEIDNLTPNHPVLLYLKGFEIIFANSYALKLTGIANSKDGILRGAAVNLLRSKIPAINYSTNPVVVETALNYAASVGVTSMQDVHSDDNRKILEELKKQNKLKSRIYDCISLKDWEKLANRRINRANGDEFIRQGCLKFAVNGDVEEIPYLTDLISMADKAELQVTVHAIGAKSNEVILNVFESIIRKNGQKDRRFRIEHAYDFRSEDLKRIVSTNTIASMQPYLFFNGTGEDSLLFRTMIDKKALLAFGSDANIVELNPLLGIYAAVYGDGSKKGISVEQAVQAYTLNSAFAEFQENIKGSITVGKLADLVILSDNIFRIKTEEIKKVKILTTILDGHIIYQAD